MDFYEAMREAQEAALDRPASVHGRKHVLWDLFMDSRVEVKRASSAIEHFAGLDVIYDESMPANTVEWRTADGRPLRRLIQVGAQWYSVDPNALPDFGA